MVSTHTGVLHERRSGTFVLLRAPGDLVDSIVSVHPYEVEVLVDHGRAPSAGPKGS